MEVLREKPHLYESVPLAEYVSADELPGISHARAMARQEADEILATQFLQTEASSVPLPVDPLGTARKINQAAEHEKTQLRQGLHEDSLRLLGEAYRKNSWEYFPPALHKRNQQTGDYEAHGHSIGDMVRSGLSVGVTETEELERRKNEFVEEATYRAIGNAGLRQSVSVTTISECPDWALQEYKQDKDGSHGGYVPGKNKLMIRSVRFMASGDRYEEQVAIPGTFLDHDTITDYLQYTGRLTSEISKTELHGTQIVNLNGEGVLPLVRELDEVASQQNGKPVFMGEQGTGDYDAVWMQSQERREYLHEQAEKLTEYVLELDRDGVDHDAANVLVNWFVQRALLSEARHDHSKASIIFDDKTAAGYQQVRQLEAFGDYDAARDLLSMVESQAPQASYCSGGSCGLKTIEKGSGDYAEASSLGLDTSGEIVKHTDGKCKSCGEKGVVYDMTNKRACLSCKKVGNYKSSK